MWLTDLADAARKSGLNVIETAGWRTRGHAPQAAVRTIVCHHTAGPATGEAPSLNVVTVGRPGLPGPLSHLVLGRSGTVYVVAAGLCYHTGATFTADQSNANAIGIEAEATGVDPWPEQQYRAYARLCRALMDHYGLPLSRVLGHKEIAAPLGRKIDPNFSMPEFRLAVSQAGGSDVMTPQQEAKLDEVLALIRPVQYTLPDGQQQWVYPMQALVNVYAAMFYGGESTPDRASLLALVDGLRVGGVDVDVLAAKVADVLAARLAA
jgi:hypothetical protein